jgi:hypothetical protein
MTAPDWAADRPQLSPIGTGNIPRRLVLVTSVKATGCCTPGGFRNIRWIANAHRAADVYGACHRQRQWVDYIDVEP